MAANTPNPATMALALAQIIDARDYCAEHGTYPDGTVGPDQGFDDWAADLATSALDASGSIVDVAVDAMRSAQDAQHGCGPVFADEARNADLPPGFSWFVRNPKTGLWFSDAKDAWVAREYATQFGTFEAAENAIKVNGLRGAEVKSSQSVR